MSEQKYGSCPDCAGMRFLRERCERCGGSGRIAVASDTPQASEYWPEGVEKAEIFDKNDPEDGR